MDRRAGVDTGTATQSPAAPLRVSRVHTGSAVAGSMLTVFSGGGGAVGSMRQPRGVDVLDVATGVRQRDRADGVSKRDPVAVSRERVRACVRA